MKTNLELYKTFYYVAKNSNITQAANELLISQPAVSKSIKTLESDLNTQLFNRKNDGVSLTNAGEILYNKIKKAMELIISAEEDLTSLNNMEKGSLNIGAGNTIMQRYLMPYIKEFHKKYPHINVKVHTLFTPELIKKAQVGLVDIVFTHLPNNIPDGFETIKIKELHDIFVVNKANEIPCQRILFGNVLFFKKVNDKFIDLTDDDVSFIKSYIDLCDMTENQKAMAGLFEYSPEEVGYKFNHKKLEK